MDTAGDPGGGTVGPAGTNGSAFGGAGSLTWLGATAGSTLAAMAALLIAGGLLLYQRLDGPFLAAPDKFFYDWRHVLLSRQEPTTRPDIALITISERTLADLPSEQPIDRAILAQLVRELTDSPAAAIGLDFRFDRPTDPAKDDALVAAIRAAGPRLVAGVVDARSGAPPRAIDYQRMLLDRAGSPRVGHLYFDRKRNGYGQPDLAVRWMARRTGAPTDVQESFAEALLTAAGRKVHDIGQATVDPKRPIGPHIAWLSPVAADGSDTFTRLEIAPPQPGTPLVPPEWREVLAGRIVIVGGEFEDRDRHLTPFSVVDSARMVGADIHAQIVAQLADNRQLRTLSPSEELVLGAIIAIVGLALGLWRHAHGGVVAYVALGIGLLLVGALAFRVFNIILPSDTMFYAALISIITGRYALSWLLGRMGFAGSPNRR